MMAQTARSIGICVFCLMILSSYFKLQSAAGSQTASSDSLSVVISARIEKGSLVYRMNGKRVEDTRTNSLLTNLGAFIRAHGNRVPALIIIDVRAPFTEVGKLETALDMSDLTYSRKLYVTDFQSGTMNEIHWDDKSVPIPTNY